MALSLVLSMHIYELMNIQGVALDVINITNFRNSININELYGSGLLSRLLL